MDLGVWDNIAIGSTSAIAGVCKGSRLPAIDLPLGAKYISTSPSARKEKESGERKSDDKHHVNSGLVASEEDFDAITDKIPQRPVSVAEGTSYSILIIAALGFAAAVLYAAAKELFFSPKEYQCYSISSERLKQDPRITVRLGSPITAYGTESANRAARQRIPHRIYNDAEGKEHIQLQYQLRGPSGRATVNADMYLADGSWQYHFLYLDVHSPLKQQVVLVRPGQPDSL